MDDGSDSSIWHKLGKLFQPRHGDSVEQAIREASEEGELDKEEGSMLQGVLSLDDLQVQDIMTPRTDIECVSDTDGIRQVAELIIETGHSRIPVYSGNRDNIIGILHAKDLLEHLLEASEQSRPASSLMREAFFVPETKNVLDLLQEFRARKNHLAVILDEYGGTAGLITIEDVLEVIVGDIEDEHDAPREEDFLCQEDGSFLISGRAHLEDLSERLPVTLVSEEVDTLGGFLTHLAGRVPENGEEFVVDGARFIIEDADAKQIHSVRMIHPKGFDAAPDACADPSLAQEAEAARSGRDGQDFFEEPGPSDMEDAAQALPQPEDSPARDNGVSGSDSASGKSAA